MGFKDKFKAIAIRITNNQALDDFCQSNFNKSIKVISVFKKRTEIQTEDFPTVLVTRPQVNREFAGTTSKKTHSIFLYAGFTSGDREKAPELAIECEELLEAAIMTKTTDVNDTPMAIMPADSLNDEGKYHPIYFFVMEVSVKDR